MSEKNINSSYPELGERPSISEQIHYMTYHHGSGPLTPKFTCLLCPNCESEFVQVVQENVFERHLICHNCMTRFVKPREIAVAA